LADFGYIRVRETSGGTATGLLASLDGRIDDALKFRQDWCCRIEGTRNNGTVIDDRVAVLERQNASFRHADATEEDIVEELRRIDNRVRIRRLPSIV
jgi:hypothetical protein